MQVVQLCTAHATDSACCCCSTAGTTGVPEPNVPPCLAQHLNFQGRACMLPQGHTRCGCWCAPLRAKGRGSAPRPRTLTPALIARTCETRRAAPFVSAHAASVACCPPAGARSHPPPAPPRLLAPPLPHSTGCPWPAGWAGQILGTARAGAAAAARRPVQPAPQRRPLWRAEGAVESRRIQPRRHGRWRISRRARQRRGLPAPYSRRCCPWQC